MTQSCVFGPLSVEYIAKVAIISVIAKYISHIFDKQYAEPENVPKNYSFLRENLGESVQGK